MSFKYNTIDTTNLNRGIVYRKDKGSYTVYTGSQFISCALSAHLWKEQAASGAARHPSKGVASDPVAVGDAVHFQTLKDGASTIIEVLPRQSKFSRQSVTTGAHATEQVIVANVDLIVPVFAAANPAPRWNMLDRYLVTAESLGLPVLICVTKADLVTDAQREVEQGVAEVLAEYRRIGYSVLLVSAVTGQGIQELKSALGGRTSVLLGKSGAGKSTLLNALQPGLGLRIGDISQATGKGKHTTTALEMFPLEIGGAVVDTPGAREFGLWNIDEDDLALFFPEMRPLVGRCRFGLDCRHDEEPGCAVRKAVVSGQISPRRYQSFLRLQKGDD